ncbi:MAG: hypothetical protein AABW49_01755 [Nanoarchaeota archaeon]
MSISHNCGFAVTHSLQDAYKAGLALQHRGREAAGIVAIGEKIDALKWIGTIDAFSIKQLHQIFPGTNYHTFMVHVRYATRGRKDKLLEDAHPHVIGGTMHPRGDHIAILNCDKAIVHNGQVAPAYFSDIPKTDVKTECDTELLLHYYAKYGEKAILQNIPGAYTLAIADKSRNDIIILRDKTGIRPGVLGISSGKYSVASEDIVFQSEEDSVAENLDPGAVYYLSHSGKYRKEQVVQPALSRCFFEWNYLANKKSIINRVSVLHLRRALGRKCAEEFHFEADYVTYLPDCPKDAAMAYSDKCNIPFMITMYKKNQERSFLGSTQEERQNSIQKNLHLIPNIKTKIQGKRIILIDDSEIRGTNAERATHLLKEEAGVKEVILINYTPMVGIIGDDGQERYCDNGVDIPKGDKFIAKGRTQEEISKLQGIPTYFLSVAGMLQTFESMGLPKHTLCTFCIGGKKPF